MGYVTQGPSRHTQPHARLQETVLLRPSSTPTVMQVSGCCPCNARIPSACYASCGQPASMRHMLSTDTFSLFRIQSLRYLAFLGHTVRPKDRRWPAARAARVATSRPGLLLFASALRLRLALLLLLLTGWLGAGLPLLELAASIHTSRQVQEMGVTHQPARDLSHWQAGTLPPLGLLLTAVVRRLARLLAGQGPAVHATSAAASRSERVDGGRTCTC